ncbi:MAG: RsbRD N-terminal domain-containing protein [Thermodesulfobacteriota bacterium]
MASRQIFEENRKKWVDKWLDVVIDTYPQESGYFFKETGDPFANPVGATLKRGINELYDVLVASKFDRDAARQALDPMIRLRAVQEFSPAGAIGFLFELKRILASDLEKSRAREKDIAEKMAVIDSRIDETSLMAFDLYMDCKKKVYELRANQARDSVRQLLLKKGLVSELPETDPELG